MDHVNWDRMKENMMYRILNTKKYKRKIDLISDLEVLENLQGDL